MGSQPENSCVFDFQDSWIPTFILLWRISRNDNMERVPVIPAKAGIQNEAVGRPAMNWIYKIRRCF
jgi:hypothetical protein